MNDIEKAKELLFGGNYSCVLVKEDTVCSSIERGVVPLLKLIESGRDFSSFCAADKILGKAAALLYAYMRIKRLYAEIVSDGAIEALQKYNITYEYEKIVPYIINRNNGAICPMEQAVAGTDKSEEAILLIKEKLSQLKGKAMLMNKIVTDT